MIELLQQIDGIKIKQNRVLLENKREFKRHNDPNATWEPGLDPDSHELQKNPNVETGKI